MALVQPLQFDQTANGQGIVQHIDFICGTSLTTFPKNDKVRLVNLGLDEASNYIQEVSDEWQVDDTTLTTVPIAYLDTVASTQSVAIDPTYLAIRGVYVNDGNEGYTKLEEATEEEIFETKYTDLGTPTHFRLIGNKIMLKPIPITTTTGNSSSKLGYALKVQYERTLIYFASDATTATVPYNPQHTGLAILFACRDYALSKGKENLNVILARIQEAKASIKNSYARRNKTQHRGMTPISENNK